MVTKKFTDKNFTIKIDVNTSIGRMMRDEFFKRRRSFFDKRKRMIIFGMQEGSKVRKI